MAYVVISPSNNFVMPGAATGDMMHYVTDPTSQRVLVGASNAAPWMAISTSNMSVAGAVTVSNNLTVTGNINFIGNLTQNGTPFVSGGGGSSSITVDSNNNPVLSTTVAWSTVQPSTQYFPKQAMAIDGANTDIAYGIALDTASNLLVAGTYNATAPTIYNSNATNSGITLPTNLGSNAAFAVKYATSTGTAQWAVAIDGAGVETATSVATDTSNNVLVAGSYTTSNVALYNASGSSNTGLPALPAPSNSSSAAYVVKYDANGTPQWATLVDSVGTDSVNAVKTDASNNVYLAGIATGSNPAIYDAASVSTIVSYPLAGPLEVATYAGSGNATYADGLGVAASFRNPQAQAIDSLGNIYVADYNNHRIRKIAPGGTVTTLAGSGMATFADGTGIAASFKQPNGVAVDASGNVYVGEFGNHRIRKITPAGVVTTLAGSGNATFADGTGTAASFWNPNGVAVDSSGNVYVADYNNNRIRKITSAGVVTTLAGSGNATFVDGTGTAASFNNPWGVAVDSSGNVYVADFGNQRIRMVTSAGVVTTLAGSGSSSFADGVGASASFNFPLGVALDSSSNVYVADMNNHRIRKMTVAVNNVTTLAGSGINNFVNGTGTAASFGNPWGVALDSSGNVYISDRSNHCIRKITPSGVVTTFAGSGNGTFADGTGIAASFNYPGGIAVDSSGNVFVAEQSGNRIRKISPAGVVTILAGSGNASFADGTGTAASFNQPYGVAVDSSGNVYVADTVNYRIRKIDTGGVVTTIAGRSSAGYVDSTTGTLAYFNQPQGIAVDSSGNVYVADQQNHRIRKITSAGVVTTLAGSGNATLADGTGTAASFSYPGGLFVDSFGTIYVGDMSNHRIRKITAAGVVTTAAGGAGFNSPWGVAVDLSGSIYVTEPDAYRVKKVGAIGTVTTILGNGNATFADGLATSASFNQPRGVSVDVGGNIYVSDTNNNRIRRFEAAGGPQVTTLAGSGNATFADGIGQFASFCNLRGAAVDSSGNIYVADQANNRIRKITSAGVVTTLAGSGSASFADGTGTAASFNSPYGVAVDSSGNVYVADQTNHRIRKITSAGVVTTLAGSGTGQFADGTGIAASFWNPRGVAVDLSGNVYVADQTNHRIRKITAAGVVTTLAGSGMATFADGTGTAASFRNPWGVAVDSTGNVYVGDNDNCRIRKITSAGVVTTLAGSGSAGYIDGTGTAASFNSPSGLTIDSSGNVYVGDTRIIRKITAAGVVTTLAGSGNFTFADGMGTAASFNQPQGIAVDSFGNLYVAEFVNQRIRKISAPMPVTTLAGSGNATFANGTGPAASFWNPRGLAIDTSGNCYVTDTSNNRIRKITPAGLVTTLAGSGNATFADGTGTAASFWSPSGVAVDSSGNVYVADQSNHRIRKISPAGVVTTLAGSGNATFADGTGTAASFAIPRGVALDSSGNVYVGDQTNNRIRKITSTGVVTTLAGSGNASFADGTGTAASFNSPFGVAVDLAGNVYVADYSNNRIRKITAAGVVTTLAGSGSLSFADGTGTAASFNSPYGVAVDSSGNVYVGDLSNHRIRKITSAGVVTTVAGTGSNSFVDGTGTAASFNSPQGVAVDSSGNIYVADTSNHRIRKLTTYTPSSSGTSLTVSGTVQMFSSSNNQSAFALKYNSTGTSQWSVTVDGSSPDSAAAIATDPSLNVYVAGKYGPNAATIYANQTPSTISTLAATSGNAAAFAIKVGSNGTPLWAIRVDGTGTEEALGAAVDTTGSLYIAGTYDTAAATLYSSNNTAFATTLPAPSNKSSFLAKYDTNGAAQWVTRIHGLTNSNIATSLALDSSNNIYLAGSYGGSQTIFNTAGAASPLTLPTTLNNGSNMAAFCIKYSSAGLPLNTWVLGGLSNAQNNAITVDSTGSNIYTTGFFTNSNTTLYDGNQMTSSIIFPSGISTQAAFVTNYTQQFSSFYLPSSLGNAANGQQKYVTNVGNAAITLNVTNSNISTVLSSNTVTPGSSTLYNWFGGSWYKQY